MIRDLNRYPGRFFETLDLLAVLPSEYANFRVVLPGDVITAEPGFMQ